MVRKALSALLLLGAVLALRVSAEEKPSSFLHNLFGNNMVLQRDVAAPIWGWTEPGKEVTVAVALADSKEPPKESKATAGADGKWLAKVGPFPAGGPYTVTIVGSQTVTLQNVLFGDVWLCSGQSNMQQGIGAARDAQQEIAAAQYPNLRLFSVPLIPSARPLANVNSQWLVCTPENVARGGWAGFSAAGYYFGRHIHKELNVPVGLIHSSWGGTVAEAWVSAEALVKLPDFAMAVKDAEQTMDAKQNDETFNKKLAEWTKTINEACAGAVERDAGSAGGGAPWAAVDLKTDDWKSMELPQLWEKAGLPDFDGLVWFRRDVQVPEGWAGKDLILHLGAIDDRDVTFVNGTKVGGLDVYNAPRDYKIAGELVKAGRNVVAVRVIDHGGGGGFSGAREQFKLELAADPKNEPLSLAGAWLYRKSVELPKFPLAPTRGGMQNTVTALYNGMIAPLVPFAIKGAIWYQGESNSGRAEQYQRLLPTLIQDWRERFGVGEFPFLIVQLASFMDTKPEPSDDPWAYLREAQASVSQKVPKCGLAVAIDIGEAKDIHPKNKQDVGRRLGLAAQAVGYGQKLVHSGPVYQSKEVKDNSLRLKFDHIGGGLIAKGGGKLEGFAIASEDMKFVWADAVIEGETVVVSSPQVQKPVAARYAWANNPICNLYNAEGLPAVPFRTDADKK
jgi:sialate O-acetylesterase